MSEPDAVITFDVDWAPDAAIDPVAERLAERGVPATWFVTHPSPAIERLRQRPDLFELGIHPNFLPGSTHGGTPDEVLRHCMALVPDATSMRTHSLFQSSRLLNLVMAETPIRADASLVLQRMRCLRPLEYRWEGASMLRVPTFWADDFELQARSPSWDAARLLEGEGLKVFLFHPIHVYLNASRPDGYDALRSSATPLRALDRTDLDRYAAARAAPGTGALLDALLDTPTHAWATVRDVAAGWNGAARGDAS